MQTCAPQDAKTSSFMKGARMIVAKFSSYGLSSGAVPPSMHLARGTPLVPRCEIDESMLTATSRQRKRAAVTPILTASSREALYTQSIAILLQLAASAATRLVNFLNSKAPTQTTDATCGQTACGVAIVTTRICRASQARETPRGCSAPWPARDPRARVRVFRPTLDDAKLSQFKPLDISTYSITARS